MTPVLSRIAAIVALLLVVQPAGAVVCEYRCLPPARDASSGARGRHDVNADVAASCHGPDHDQTSAKPESSNGEFLTSAPAVCVHDGESVTLSVVVKKSARVSPDANALPVSTIFGALDGRAPLQRRANHQPPAPPGAAPLLSSLLRV